MAIFDPILQLEAEIASKQQELKQLRNSARKDAINTIRDLVAMFNLSAEELSSLASKSGPAPVAQEDSGKKPKLPIKYYDPSSGKKWTGAPRGKIPEPFNTIIKNHDGDREKAAAELAQYLV